MTWKKSGFILAKCRWAWVLLLLTATAAAGADQADAPRPSYSYDRHFGPYHSFASLALPLSEKPLPQLSGLSETEIYRRLFLSQSLPHFFALTGHLFPVATGASWLRRNETNLYNAAELGGSGINLFEAISAGYDHPWATSLFFGNVVEFAEESAEAADLNRGYMGYQISFGNKHIKNNQLIPDDWWEFEWQLRGDHTVGRNTLSWHYALGTRTHANPEIADTIYVIASRNRLNFSSKVLSWLNNGGIRMRLEFDRDSLDFARQELILTKRFPSRRLSMAFTIDFGVIYQNDQKYSGSLRDDEAEKVIILIQPGFEF